MLNTLFTIKQHPKKGEGKVGEESESNLNMRKEMVEQDPIMENQNIENGVLMGEEEEPKQNQDKQKVIILGESNASEDSKNSKIDSKEGGEDSTNYPKESSPLLLFGFIIDPTKGNQKAAYSCGFCNKSFVTPQALGGHQNGHKWERNLKQGIQAINIARGRSSCYDFSSPTLPSYEPFSGGLNPMTQQHLEKYHPQTSYAMIECGYQSYGLDKMIQHTGVANTSFGTGYGMLDIGNSSAFQHPEMVRFNHGFETSNYDRMENVYYGMHSQTDHEVKETGKTGFDFVLLPMGNDQIIGNQRVTSSEIDFGLLPKRDGEDTEIQHD
ncbi:Zinc finger C2H2-type [Sesbania bispinosa]|nr:Zinc finger C2H2-type [Sesbania bispinosa]